MYNCGGLTLARHHVPTKLLYHFSSSTGQGEENMMKALWVVIRTETSFTNYRHR